MNARGDILVVEDERPIRRLLQAALTAEGYAVEETGSGTQALSMMQAGSFDLLVLDLHIDDLSGWDVLVEMHRNGMRDDIKVLILTAQSAERDILRGWRMGVDAYIMKPFEPADLVDKVHEVLASTSEQLELDRKEELTKTELLHLVDTIFDS